MDIYDFYRNDPALQSYLLKQADAICRHPGFSKSDFEEQLQILVCHLYEKRHHYDPGLSSQWTFAVKVTDNKVRSILRSRKAQKRDPKREEMSVNDIVDSGDGNPTSAHETIPSCHPDHIRQSDLFADLETLMSRLDLIDRSVMQLQRRGLTHKEIRSLLSLSVRELQASFQRIAAIAKELRLDEYF